jgi:hypothetical protein
MRKTSFWSGAAGASGWLIGPEKDRTQVKLFQAPFK